MSSKPEEEKKEQRVPNDIGLEDLDKEEEGKESPKANREGPSGGAPAAANNASGSPRGSPQRSPRDEEEEKKEEEKKDAERIVEESKEEEKQEAADLQQSKKMSKTTQFVDDKLLVAQCRSNLLTMNDRHLLEEEILRPIMAGSGLLGTTKIDLLQRKREVCQIKDSKKLPQNDELIDFLEADGIFIDSQLMFKNKDINVQKLEERLLNNGQSEYFKLNGEIKINNDLFADELTRPSDLAFEQTDAFQTVEHNAIKTDRMNSFKSRYYRIDIIVGKIIIRTFSSLFSEEDQLMVNLKHMCKDYDRRVSMALLPFYKDRLDHIKEEIKQKSSSEKGKKDLPFLKKMRENLKNDFESEKNELKDMAQAIYDLWLRIDKIRIDRKYPETQYDLKVHKGDPVGPGDVQFNIVKRKNIGQLQPEVEQRKRKTENTRVYCRLLIDGERVAETKKVPVQWPSYELDILDQFQIHVFTLPGKVQLEILINDVVTDVIDLVIPGTHVKSLTSASRLIKEYRFSRKELHIENKLKQGIDLRKDKDKLTEAEKKRLANEEATMAKLDTSGSVFVKAEWEGYGEQMPPAKSETLLEMKMNEKNRFFYTKQEQHDLLLKQKPIDVNDPRNEEIIKEIQRMKNDYMDRLLADDAKFQLHDIQSFRLKLLEARNNDPNFAMVPVPQLNSELIDGERCKLYIDWLEEIHRQETFKAYLAKKRNIELKAEEESKSEADDLEMYDVPTLERRQAIFDKINKRRKLKQSGTAANRQVHYDSTVSEFQFEDDDSFIENLKNIFKVSRKLKPTVRKRESRPIDNLDKASILVHIIRATDVPVRLSYYDQYLDYIQQQEESNSTNDQNAMLKKLYQLKQVETFVEVRVVDLESGKSQTQKTCVSEGQSPEWNEILEFAIGAANKIAFTLEELQNSKVQIYFTLFDQEVTIDEITKMKQVMYIENRYLGSIQIPLTTILSGTKFEGQIRLNRPLVLQNYRVVQDEIMFMDKDGIEDQQKRDEEQIPTYINVSISLEPLITVPKTNEKDYYSGAEKGPFLEFGQAWITKIYNKFKKSPRLAKCFFENLEGQSVFVCKFLHPIAPPEHIYSQQNSKKGIERAARFVSLIPYVDDSSLFKDMNDLTCTCQEFLDLGMGDSEEHAILLCNYFNHIDIQEKRQVPHGESFQSAKQDFHSYIVYGEAVPEGTCWFVARRDRINNYMEIWNPMTAECYSFDLILNQVKGVFGFQKNATMNQRPGDPQCTMQKIYCIVGQENVWANIQKDEAPVLLNFRLEDSKLWAPFLDEKKKAEFFGQATSINNYQIQLKTGTEMMYSAKKNSTSKLEEQIKKFLVGKFEDERIAQVKKTTNWNIVVGETMRHILTADMEEKIIKDLLADVKQDLEPKGRKKIFDKNEITYQKYFVNKTMGNVLIDFEEYMFLARRGGTESKMRPEEEAKKDEDIRASVVQEFLKQIAQNVKKTCWAIPINVPLTSREEIWEAIKNTRVHEIDNQDIEFSLSVMVKSYPCNVYSVWIYLAIFKDSNEEF